MNFATHLVNNECVFLERLPAELRVKIYECLLCNEILGTAGSVTKASGFGALVNYNLSPQVLRLCHQIYNEALPVLYEKNVFYMACLRVENNPHTNNFFGYDDEGDGAITVQGPQVELSPLTRYENNRTTIPFPIPLLCNYASVRRVLHWRVVISRLRTPGGMWDPKWCLLDFCRSICAKPPTNLELLLIPCGLDYSEDDVYAFDCFDQALKPLRMLRNLRKFVIRDASATDVPDIIRISSDAELKRFRERPEGLPREFEIPTNLKTELQILLTSLQPVDLLYKMHENLSTYAQAFERYRPYKMHMGLRREDINDIDHRDLKYMEYIKTGAFNPFNKPTFHPLEYALQHCKESATSGYVEIFKEHRRNALTYLESQFAAIEAANREITEFVKQEKIPGGLFDVAKRNEEKATFSRAWDSFQIDDSDKQAKMALALIYLEDYGASFNRHLTHAVRAQILSNRRLFESHYNSLTRDILIKALGRDTEIGKIRHFLTKYSTAVDLCDMQYLEILQARKKLFEFDGFDPECEIDLKLSRSEEMIDWNTNEPNLTPYQQWSEYDYGEYSDDEM